MMMYIDRNRELFEGKSVMELGAGLGLPGMHLVESCKPESLVLSDYDTSVTEESLRLNNIPFTQSNVAIEKVDWENSTKSATKYDIIIACDCIYRTTWIPFLQTVQHYLSDDGMLIIYNGIRGSDTDEFVYALQELYVISEYETQKMIFDDKYVTGLLHIVARK